MLEIRPNCECCDIDLPPESTNAMICTYECTFCTECVDGVLQNVCPNCGGGFTPRPIRPKTAWRNGLSLEHQPASTIRVHSKYNQTELEAFAEKIMHLKPELR